jgi:glycosyltransferase involved in cell wall biosynthesis
MNKIIISGYDDLNNPYYAGGGANAVHQVAKRLARDFKVVVLSGNYPGAKDVLTDGVNYKRIGISWGGPYLGQLVYHAALVKSAVKMDFDIWIESFTPPFSTSFLPLFTGKPVIGLVHMLSGDDMQRKYKLPFRYVERVGLKLYRNFIVLTNEVKKEIRKYNPESCVSVIPNSTQLPQVASRRKKHILFIGRLEVDQKGLDLLINSFSLLKRKTGTEKLKLIIAGSGNENDINKLKSMIKNSGNAAFIELCGLVTGSKKKRLFEEAYLLALPSRFDTYPTVALEAFSYNLPVVCFDIKGTAWMPKGASFRVGSFDEAAFCRMMEKLVKDARLRAKAGKLGRKFIENYTWDEATDKYKAVIADMKGVLPAYE